MKILWKSFLGLFVLVSIGSMMIIANLISNDGMEERTLFSKETIKPTLIVREELADKDSKVELIIGKTSLKLDNVFVIQVQNNKGEIQLITSEEFVRFDERYASTHGSILESSNNSLKDLLLQTVTASSSVYAATLCCTGPSRNGNGETIARQCQKSITPECPL